MFEVVESSSFSLSKSKDKNNEDAVLSQKMLDDGLLFCVADGVGSYSGARYASRSVIEYLSSLRTADELCDTEYLFSQLKEVVGRLGVENDSYQKAATTLTFGYLSEKGLQVGHIGDCRLYVKNGLKLDQLTKDHTQYQMLLDEKLFTKRQLQDKKDKAQSVLTTAISKFVEMNAESFFIPLNELPSVDGTYSFYIMTDGAYKFWDKRKRFSQNTMNSTNNFALSLKKRIERSGPVDDYSLVGLSVRFS